MVLREKEELAEELKKEPVKQVLRLDSTFIDKIKDFIF